MTGVQTCALPICFPVTIWFIIGFLVVGYDVLNDIRLGMDWRLMLSIGHILLCLVVIWPIYLGVRK